MRYDQLYISGTGTWLPPAVATDEAVADGRWTRASRARDGIVSVTVAGNDIPPEMAARAGRRALAAAGFGADDVDLVLHSSVHHQGLDLWAAASFVQNQVVGNTCPAFEVRQMSAGGMAALELGAASVAGRSRPWSADGPRAASRPAVALLTAADKFCLPGYDRWRSESGMVFADGGSALVLSNRAGFARVRSVVTVSDTGLEALHRGDEAFTDAPFLNGPPDADRRVRDYVRDHGRADTLVRLRAGQDEALKAVLDEAETTLGEIDWYVLPNFGFARLDAAYFRRFEIDPDRTTWPWAKTVGHLGAADQFAGLHYLQRAGKLQPGQRCLLSAVGSGMSWTCAVIEIVGDAMAAAG
ncbi:ketoacyl-ACP synthase III family protein [Streptomyces sp. NPDC050535]|uniref:ketoacyl-ACP synthase III family protein n=1 Tax=Streptomyces sp. NPDC050535 TaxID=3365626 RepID=UPI0037ABC66A